MPNVCACAWQTCLRMAGLGSVQLRKLCFYCAQLHQLRNLCQTRVYMNPVQNALGDFCHHQPTIAGFTLLLTD